MTCLFSDVATCSGATSEHIVQACLGGTRERVDVICESCNHYFGDNIDPGLCDYYGPIIDVLRPLMPARFRQVVRHATSVDGNLPLVRMSGGAVGLRKIQKEYNDDGSLKTIYAPANTDHRQLQAIVSSIAPGRTGKFSTVPVTELTPTGMSNYHSVFAAREHRAAIKTILEVFDWQANSFGLTKYARAQQLRAARNYVRNGIYEGHIDSMVCPMYNLEEEFGRIFTNSEDSFSNRVLFCNNASRKLCYGFLQIANTMPLGICLGESIEGSDFTLIYEAELFAHGAERSERVDGSLISLNEYNWAKFISPTRESVLFAFSKMREAFDREYGRATFIIDMRDDERVGESLTTYSHDAVVNRGISGNRLLRATCEPLLLLRFRQGSISAACWDAVLNSSAPSAFDAAVLETSLRTSGAMGSQGSLILEHFRKLLQLLVGRHGYPRMNTVFRAELGGPPRM